MEHKTVYRVIMFNHSGFEVDQSKEFDTYQEAVEEMEFDKKYYRASGYKFRIVEEHSKVLWRCNHN